MFVGRKDDHDGNEVTTLAPAGCAQAYPGGSHAGRGQGDRRRVPRAAGRRADVLSLAQSIRRSVSGSPAGSPGNTAPPSVTAGPARRSPTGTPRYGPGCASGPNSIPLGVSPRLPRRPRRGLGGQPQTPPTTVAREGSAGAAAPPPQTRRRQHRGRDRGCRRAKSSVGGRLSIRRWKYQYNHHRPHSALNYEPPARYAATCAHR